MTASAGACLVIGAGDGLGAAIARNFADEGLSVCLTRRPRHVDTLEKTVDAIRAAGGEAHGFGVDARNEDDMAALFDRIERDVAQLNVVVFNIGTNVNFPIRETTAQVYRKVWEMAAFAGFLAGRESARVMVPRKQGTIIFTGATASIRGGAGFAAFAGAKHALRALAQSMARELGPEGIHVAHTIVDGAIDGDFIRGLMPDAADLAAQDRILSPCDIARSYVHLWKQPKSAWTHELDLRPWAEKW
ncbi:MAG: SDR family NAD(P)-dependent oxidoreductase [Alphaproteobacteria bacterium]|nr:SDR family NAD(P)-dependent oxidoreductase [Alphaproteobacteria bacterium]